jgi:bacterial leucyl aminopeptidase
LFQQIVSSVEELSKSAKTGTKLTVKFFNHSWKKVPSVIARYESTTVDPSLVGIVITGSHMDTLGEGGPGPEPHNNPAADDCASGSSAVFEALRVLVTSGFVPGRPIEFHWYTGEEEGILGSNEVAEAYAKAGTKVVSYLNLDQSGCKYSELLFKSPFIHFFLLAQMSSLELKLLWG